MELQVKVSASAGTMEIIEEVNDNKFRVLINPSSASVTVEVDGTYKSGTGCTGLQSKKNLIGRWRLGDHCGFSDCQ